jgi:hypothetical protein
LFYSLLLPPTDATANEDLEGRERLNDWQGRLLLCALFTCEGAPYCCSLHDLLYFILFVDSISVRLRASVYFAVDC